MSYNGMENRDQRRGSGFSSPTDLGVRPDLKLSLLFSPKISTRCSGGC